MARWPHDASVYQMLSAVGRPEALREASKRYRLDEYDLSAATGLEDAGLPMCEFSCSAAVLAVVASDGRCCCRQTRGICASLPSHSHCYSPSLS